MRVRQATNAVIIFTIRPPPTVSRIKSMSVAGVKNATQAKTIRPIIKGWVQSHFTNFILVILFKYSVDAIVHLFKVAFDAQL